MGLDKQTLLGLLLILIVVVIAIWLGNKQGEKTGQKISDVSKEISEQGERLRKKFLTKTFVGFIISVEYKNNPDFIMEAYITFSIITDSFYKFRVDIFASIPSDLADQIELHREYTIELEYTKRGWAVSHLSMLVEQLPSKPAL